MAKITACIRDDYVKHNDKCALYLRIFLNNKYQNISLGIDIEPKKFDKKKQMAKNKIINQRISAAKGLANEIILKYNVNKKKLTHILFKKEFKNPQLFIDFYAFMVDEITARRGDVSDGTIKQHFACVNKMKKYKKTLNFSELDINFLTGYKKFLKRKKQAQNTIHHSFKIIKTYVNIAIKTELLDKSPFKNFKIKREKTYPTFLTLDERDELMKLYKSKKLDKSKIDYKKVLRHFLFACYTGLRISDFMNLKFENIINNKIYIHPLKTQNVNNKRIAIPFTKTMKQLIKDENPHKIKGKIFDSFAEQTMNARLKDIAKIANINKNITFHVARHTFATGFLKLNTGADTILALRELLGHSKIDTTMVYLHAVSEDIEKKMLNFDS